MAHARLGRRAFRSRARGSHGWLPRRDARRQRPDRASRQGGPLRALARVAFAKTYDRPHDQARRSARSGAARRAARSGDRARQTRRGEGRRLPPRFGSTNLRRGSSIGTSKSTETRPRACSCALARPPRPGRVRSFRARRAAWGARRARRARSAAFLDCVRRPASRAVLLTGPEGVGKSRVRHELLKVASRHEQAPPCGRRAASRSDVVRPLPCSRAS